MLGCEADESLKAKVSLNLQDQGFPGDALVAVEAYRRSSAMRFDCGTVDALSIPNPLVLSEVDRSGSVLFRLKVIDGNEERGRLLGSAEHIRPKDDGNSEGRRRLLPVDWLDIGDDVWKVEIEHSDSPRLIINYRISASSIIFLSNPIVQGVLLPAALRFVLQELARASDAGKSEDGPEWEEEWLEFCKAELGIHDDPRNFTEESEKKNWIDYAVKKFCKKKSFLDGIDRSLRGA